MCKSVIIVERDVIKHSKGSAMFSNLLFYFYLTKIRTYKNITSE